MAKQSVVVTGIGLVTGRWREDYEKLDERRAFATELLQVPEGQSLLPEDARQYARAIEALPVAAIGERRQHAVARRGALGAGVRVPAVLVGGAQPAQAGERVVPPGAVVDGAGHGVPVLAVVDDVDADLGLPGDDVAHALLHGGHELVP